MDKIFQFICCFIISFCSLEAKNETIFKGSLESLEGSEEEISYIKEFPFSLYKIYHVNELGFFFIDNIPDKIKHELRKGNIWEPHIFENLNKYVIPGTVVVDIGAHIGTHVLHLSKLVGEGKVIAFEPQKKLFAELVWNCTLNQCINVTALRCALGKQRRLIQMEVPLKYNEGGTSLGKGGDFAPMVLLDDLNLKDISLIKIDVENTEDEVLLGAKETLKRNRPVIIIEMQGNRYSMSNEERDQKIANTHKLLNKLGYQVFHIWDNDWLALPSL